MWVIVASEGYDIPEVIGPFPTEGSAKHWLAEHPDVGEANIVQLIDRDNAA